MKLSTFKQQIAVAALAALIFYTPINPDLFWDALQAAGSGIGRSDIGKRLAMLGDSIMKTVLLHDGLHTGDSPGTIDRKIQKIVSNTTLAKVCDDAGLTPFINGNPSQQGVQSPKTRATTVEAVLAAVYEDSGMDHDAVKRVMHVLGLSYDGKYAM